MRGRVDESEKSMTNRQVPFALCVLMIGLGVATASAQNPSSVSGRTAQGTKRPAAIRTTTRLVQLSVIVRDKHDELVADLAKNDFTVLDNGKPQQVQIFSVTTSRPPPSRLPFSLAPDTYSNRAPSPGDAPANITVILLDALNTPFSNQAFANGRLLRFLQQLQPQDRVALYTLGNRLKILHDFTSDASSLVAALKDYKGQLSELDKGEVEDLGYGGNPMARLLSRDEGQNEGERDLTKRVNLTLEAMVQIAQHLAPLAGRKNLIWVSGSFPLSSAYVQLNPARERIVFSTEFTNVVEALANDSLVIYPVDARGLVPTDTETFSGPDQLEFMTMKSLAAETGGRAFFNTNDIGGAVRAAIDDSRVSYELGYYPGTGNWDGTFHRIKVKINRPGVSVRTRNGYLAIDHPGPTPLEAHAIDMTVRVGKAKSENGSPKALDVDVLIDPRQLALKLESGRERGIVDLVFVQSNDQDKVLDTIDQPYGVMLLPTTYEQPPPDGFKFTQTIRVAPDAARLQVTVRDRSTGLAGAVEVPLAKYFPKQTNESR